MIDFSKISKGSIAGSFLRMILRLIPGSTTMIIAQGFLKGSRWKKGSGVNSYWLGTYEKEEQELFIGRIKKSDVVYDIGANVGFYTLIASKIVGEQGVIYSFEPAPQNLGYIKKHIDINHLKNVVIVEGGVADKSDYMYFDSGNHAATGFLTQSLGGILVPTINIDHLVQNKIIKAPNVIKMDIEGAELLALNGAKATLELYKPTIFLSTHNKEVHAECVKLLMVLGYGLSSMNEFDVDNTTELLAEFKG